MTGLGVTVTVLAKDEGETLGRAIESTLGLADEVVVGVDVATTDNTRQVALSAGARVVDVDFQGDCQGRFCDAHNLLLAEARGIWVVKLDGHEYFLPGHAQGLRSVLDGAPDAVGGVSCRVQLTFIERSARAVTLRIHRHSPDVRYVGAVHEHLEGLGGAVVARPDIVIWHDRSAARVAARIEQRMGPERDLLAGAVETWTSARDLHTLAGRLRDSGDAVHAAALLDRAWELAAEESEVIRCMIAADAAATQLRLRDGERSAVWAQRGVQICPFIPELYCLLGDAAAMRGDVVIARQYYQCALEVPFVPWGYPHELRYRTWLPRMRLAGIAQAANQTAEHRKWRKEAIAMARAIRSAEPTG